MAWAKIDDQFYLNPKNAGIDRDEQDMYLSSLVYCNGQLTDGFVPAGTISLLAVWAKLPIEANAQAIAQRLVEHNYWDLVEGGFNVHDFLDWNMSKAEVLALKNARTEAGRAGGLKSVAKRQAIAKASAQAKSKQSSTQYQYQSLNLEQQQEGGTPAPIYVPAEDAIDPSGEVFSAYQDNIGQLSKVIADRIDGDIRDFSSEWVLAAIEEAVRQEKRNLAYIEGILKRWKREGFRSDTRAPVPPRAIAGDRMSTLEKSLAAGKRAMQKALAEEEAQIGNPK